MHLPGGILDQGPCIVTGVIAAAALGYAVYRLRREMNPGVAPRMAVTAAVVFAAQMVNYPVSGGISGHVLGGVLAVTLLGPWAGLLAMSVVLVVQCLLFQDGGLSALGANVLNMGVVGALGGYGVYAFVRQRLGGPRGAIVGSVVASWLAVMVGALFCAVEFASGGKVGLIAAISAMLPVHAMIGAGEAAVTGLVVALMVKMQPELIYDPQRPVALARTGRSIWAGLAIALAVAAFVSPWASSFPDGLESSLTRLHAEPVHVPFELSSPLSNYQFPYVANAAAGGAVAGLLGTLIVFVAVGAIAWPLPRRDVRRPIQQGR